MIALLVAAGLLVGGEGATPRPSAQDIYNGRANQLRVRPPRLDEAGVSQDGRLDEPQWARAALLTALSIDDQPSPHTRSRDHG